MPADITIRAERPGDTPTISQVVRRAYGSVAYSDHREHLMIERLRSKAAFIPALSLVAEMAGEPVGHILLTKASIVSEGSSVATLALAPLSVVPGYQGIGIGKSLVQAAHQRAIELGFTSIVLVGIPFYYAQFGYEPLRGYPIMLPFDAPDEDCMILPLKPHALEGVGGLVHYAQEWLDH